jgi:hypothetical protein
MKVPAGAGPERDVLMILEFLNMEVYKLTASSA